MGPRRLRKRDIYMQPRSTTVRHGRTCTSPPIFRRNAKAPTKLGTQTTDPTALPTRNRMVAHRNIEGTTCPMGTGLVFSRTRTPASRRSRNGCVGEHRLRRSVPTSGGTVIFFYGKWTSQELTLHINEKESLVSYWELVLFGNATPTFCANMRFTRVYSNERIDNTVAISVAHKNSGKSWRLAKLA